MFYHFIYLTKGFRMKPKVQSTFSLQNHLNSSKVNRKVQEEPQAEAAANKFVKTTNFKQWENSNFSKTWNRLSNRHLV